MLGYNKLAGLQIQDLGKGPHHAGVGRDPALEHDRSVEFLAAGDRALKIAGDGETEPGHDIVIGSGDLLQVDHVGFGENTATPGDARRMLRLESHLPELVLYPDFQAIGLLVEERTRPCRTLGIHGEVLDKLLGPVEDEQLGVLATHLDNRPRRRHQLEIASGQRCYFAEEFASQDRLHRLAADAGGAQVKSLTFQMAEFVAKDVEEGLERTSLKPPIGRRHDLSAVDHYHLGRHGAYIYSQRQQCITHTL